MSEIEDIVKRNRSLWGDTSAGCSSCRGGHPDGNTQKIGTDTAPTYADIELVTCKECGSVWLDYFFEYESFSSSGTRYRGLIPEQIATILRLSPSRSLEVFNALPWYYNRGARTSGPPSLM